MVLLKIQSFKMLKTVKSVSIFVRSSSFSYNFAVFSYFSSKSSSPSSSLNHELVNYLINTVKLSESQALTISNRFSYIKSIHNPQSVYHFLQSLGFSNSHIQSTIRGVPQILFANIDKSIKPKIKFFEELGLVGYDLGKVISHNPTVLTSSVERKLIPRIEILKKLLNDDDEKQLVKCISRNAWIVNKLSNPRFLINVAFLESCRIDRFQLSRLLKFFPRIFINEESALRDLVSRVFNLGFSVDSRMFVHALVTVSCLSEETMSKKIEVLKSLGFSEYECTVMFRKQPGLLRCSEKKLKLGIDVFLNTVKIEKEVLIRNPFCLTSSIEERVIPRYKVLKIIKSKKLLKKQPSFMWVLLLTEEQFLHKFIARFPDDAEELSVAYNGHALDSSSEVENLDSS